MFEALIGLSAFLFIVAINGAFRISTLKSTIRDMEYWSYHNERHTAEVERKLAVSEAANRALNDINAQLRAELDNTHADLTKQKDLAFAHMHDAKKWRDHTSKLKAMASAAGKASAAARRARKAKTTERLRCGA